MERHKPKYQVIAENIRNGIEKGSYGEKLPIEPDLAKRYGVSTLTVRHAKEQLILEGLLVVRQGYGTYIIPKNTILAEGDDSDSHLPSSSTDEVEIIGHTPELTQLQVELYPVALAVLAMYSLNIPSYPESSRSNLSGAREEIVFHAVTDPLISQVLERNAETVIPQQIKDALWPNVTAEDKVTAVARSEGLWQAAEILDNNCLSTISAVERSPRGRQKKLQG